jgi:hypothetical protein
VDNYREDTMSTEQQTREQLFVAWHDDSPLRSISAFSATAAAEKYVNACGRPSMGLLGPVKPAPLPLGTVIHVAAMSEQSTHVIQIGWASSGDECSDE